MTGILRLVVALSFLSRLAPAQDVDEDDIADSLVWFPAAGLCMGTVLVLPFVFGLGGGNPTLQGVLFVLFSLWLTRALHWDGWADLFDALGSGKHGDEFQDVLKDSRVGTFGVIAVTGGIICAAVCTGNLFAANRWPALIWAVMLGRCMVAPLSLVSPVSPRSTLGRLVSPGSNGRSLMASVLFGLAAGIICCGVLVTLTGAVLAAAGLVMFARISQREGGLNGDYYGAIIIWGELSALVCAVLFG